MSNFKEYLTEGINKWFPKGEKDDKVTQLPQFYRMHYKKELMGQGTRRVIAFYSNFNKLKKDFNKLIKQDSDVTGVYRFNIPEGVTYDEAMKSGKYAIEVFDENTMKLVE